MVRVFTAEFSRWLGIARKSEFFLATGSFDEEGDYGARLSSDGDFYVYLT